MPDKLWACVMAQECGSSRKKAQIETLWGNTRRMELSLKSHKNQVAREWIRLSSRVSKTCFKNKMKQVLLKDFHNFFIAKNKQINVPNDHDLSYSKLNASSNITSSTAEP